MEQITKPLLIGHGQNDVRCKLVEAILQGRQPVELTATRLTELDLPLDWTEQRKLLAS